MKIGRWSVTLLATLALVMAACTAESPAASAGASGSQPSGGEEVSLDFWVFEEGGVGTFLETVVSEFEAENPNIHIEVTAFPEDQYGVKIDTALAAGAPPDLTLVFGPDQMRQGLLLPLDDMVAEQGIDLATFGQAIVQGPGDFSCAWEGTLYCLGSYQGAVMMFYNKDMFDAAGIEYPAAWPPMTVDEFIDTACQLTDPDNEIWGAAYGETILPWEMAVSEDGRTVAINSPTAVHNYDLLAKGIRDGCAPSANIIDPWEQGADFFSQGKLAMVVTDYQSLVGIEEAGINYGTTSIPTPEGIEPFFDVWTDSVGVFADSEHPDEAKLFIAFLATRGQELQVEINGNIPLDSAVAEQLNWAEDIPGRLDALEILAHSRPAIFIPDKWNAWGPYYDAFGLMAGGEASAQEALDDAAPKIQEDLDSAWEVWDEGA